RRLDPMRTRGVHDVVVGVGTIRLTRVGMHCQRQLDDTAPNALHLWRVDADLHVCAAWGGARSWKAAHALDLDKAGSARAACLLIGVLAQLRHVDARGVDRVQGAGACWDVYGVTIDPDADESACRFGVHCHELTMPLRWGNTRPWRNGLGRVRRPHQGNA